MNNKYFKVLIISLSLSGLLGVVACATGGGGGTPVSTTPSGGYLNPSPTPGDPEFWKLWESAHGLG